MINFELSSNCYINTETQCLVENGSVYKIIRDQWTILKCLIDNFPERVSIEKLIKVLESKPKHNGDIRTLSEKNIWDTVWNLRNKHYLLDQCIITIDNGFRISKIENCKSNAENAFSDTDTPQKKSADPIIRSTDYKVRSSYVKEAHTTTLHSIKAGFTNDTVVFLEGMGGLGKSELAKYYGLSGKEDDIYNTVIFAQLNEEKNNNIETVFNSDSLININNFNRKDKENNRDYFLRKADEFKRVADEKTLLILDNYKPEEDLRYLLGGRYHLLITTREIYNNGDFTAVKMETIHNFDVLKKIFENNLPPHKKALLKQNNADTSLKLIFDSVTNHTYAVELVAKSISSTSYTLERYAEIICRKFSALEGTIQSVYKKDRLTPYQIIKELFNLNELLNSENSDEIKELLVFLSAMPTKGIEEDILCNWLSPAMINTLNELIDSSWLRRDIFDNECIISMHPLIKEVVITEIGSKTENCREIISCLINDDAKYIDGLYHQPYYIKEKYIHIYLHLLSAFKGEKDAFPFYAKAARILISCGEHMTALSLLTSMQSNMSDEEKESWEFGYIQYKLGTLHTTLLRIPEPGLAYFEKAIGLMERYAVTAEEKIFLAMLYRETGTLHCRIYCGIYLNVSDLKSSSDISESYFSKGQHLVNELLCLNPDNINLKIYEATLDIWRSQIAIFKDNNLDEAETLLKKSEATFKKHGYINAVDKSAIFGMLAKIYQIKKDYKNQIECIKNDIDVFEKYFGKYHRANVERYLELSGAYINDLDRLSAVDTLVKCKEIAVKTYSETHDIVYVIEDKITELC